MPPSRRPRKANALPHGAYSYIGRQLVPPVSAQHVREVFKGNRTSPRVERAICAYARALEELKNSA